MNCTAKKKNANWAPTNNAITLTAPARARSRSSQRSRTGEEVLRSSWTKVPSSTAASAKPPMVPSEPHPWSGAFTKAKTSAAEPSVAVTAPGRSNRPGRGAVSLTKRRVRARTVRPIGTLMNSDHRQDA